MGRRDLSLIDLLDRILERGIVINGDITITIGKVELLSLKINLVIASLETAKRFGVKLPWETSPKDSHELPPKPVIGAKRRR